MSLKSADIDSETGKFSGYLSTYENEDRDGDIIKRGAFDKGVAKKSTVPMLFNHRRDEVLGKLDLIADAKGLYAEGVLNMSDEKVKNVYELLKMGALDSMSVGMIINKYSPIDPKNPWGAWEIMEAEAVEGSIVAIPANDQATIDYVKSLKESEEMFNKKTKDLTKEELLAKLAEIEAAEKAEGEAGAGEQGSEAPTEEKSPELLIQIEKAQEVVVGLQKQVTDLQMKLSEKEQELTEKSKIDEEVTRKLASLLKLNLDDKSTDEQKQLSEEEIEYEKKYKALYGGDA